MLEIMHDVSISARLTTTTTKVGWWSVGDHARCIHLRTVNYNYDEGGMVECWRSCTIYPSQHCKLQLRRRRDGGVLEIMHDVSISARITTNTTNNGWWNS